MATLYCPECGYKNQYSIHPPTFCGGCGERISKGSNNEKKSIRKIKKAKAQEDPNSEETDIDFVPTLSKGSLEVDISFEMEGRQLI
ncbi:MAG TPA: hypothetical protein DEG69_20175, partial [Flavobacteriaceae bacterium]|nr:hypothetical protein [Flavobacteriaceae bacterium]